MSRNTTVCRGEASRAGAACPSGARLLSGLMVEGGEVLERLTPLDLRTDPSHPRVDLAGPLPAGKKMNLTPQSDFSDLYFPFVWTPQTTTSNPCSLDRKNDQGRVTGDEAGLDEVGRTGGAAKASQSDDGSGALSHRPDHLAIATATATTPKAPPAATSFAQWGQGIQHPGDDAIRFDPPSIRNGLKGLSTQAVDKVLLGVETAAAGSRSCWCTPRALECSQVPGKTVDTGSGGSDLFQAAACGEENSDMRAGSRARETMRRVIRAPRIAQGLSLNRRNRWRGVVTLLEGWLGHFCSLATQDMP